MSIVQTIKTVALSHMKEDTPLHVKRAFIVLCDALDDDLEESLYPGSLPVNDAIEGMDNALIGEPFIEEVEPLDEEEEEEEEEEIEEEEEEEDDMDDIQLGEVYPSTYSDEGEEEEEEEEELEEEK